MLSIEIAPVTPIVTLPPLLDLKGVFPTIPLLASDNVPAVTKILPALPLLPGSALAMMPVTDIGSRPPVPATGPGV